MAAGPTDRCDATAGDSWSLLLAAAGGAALCVAGKLCVAGGLVRDDMERGSATAVGLRWALQAAAVARLLLCDLVVELRLCLLASAPFALLWSQGDMWCRRSSSARASDTSSSRQGSAHACMLQG
jgi:hypothetical protein